MTRYTWKGYVYPGKLEEYIRRHDEIWPEMTALLNEAGIHNYSIWNIGDELFGYYECSDLPFALKTQTESPVVARWNEFMKDVMHMEMDEEGNQPLPKQVFLHP